MKNNTPVVKSVISDSNLNKNHRTVSAPLGHKLIELAKENSKIVGMSADLAKYTDMHIFRDEFPDRFYQVGMSEQLMMCAAGGLAKEGFIPFISTYATFASRRGCDFISQAICEQDANVKILGGLPGLTTGYGPSHQATDDLSVLRAMPNLVIIDPCDALDLEQAVEAIVEYDKPVYMRILRGQVPLVLDEYNYKFEIGKAALLKDGKDVLFISTGLMTMNVLDAAKELEKDNIEVAVLHVPTIKPLDKEAIIREASKEDRIVVVAENHSVIGGFGESVSSVFIHNGICPKFYQIGLPDEFLDAGTLSVLQDKYGISPGAITKQVKNWLNR